MSANRGFTLVEVIVVLLTTSVLMMLAVPSIRNMNEQNDLREAMELLSADLKLARSEAALRGKNVGMFHGNNGMQWCYGLHERTPAQDTCNCLVANDCSIKTVPGDRFGNISASSNPLINPINFESIGTISQTTVITLTTGRSNFTAKIKLNPIGKLTRCSNDISGYLPDASC